MSSRGNPVVTLRLTPEQVKNLKEAAKKREMTVSDLIKAAIQLYLLNEYK